MNQESVDIGARLDRIDRLLAQIAGELAGAATHAIFVDAGYLYAAAGRLVTGTEDRKGFELDAQGLIDALVDCASHVFPHSRLLRVYWYDGARRRIHTAEQQSIAELPDVKVRLGNLNANNQQKGVDSLIRGDLESLARHRAIGDAVLLGGDEDLVPAVEAAQDFGARVHLWGIEAPEGLRNQADPLLWEVDTQRTLDLAFLKPYAARRTVVTFDDAVVPRPTWDDVHFVGKRVAATWYSTKGPETLAALLPGPYLPGPVDQDLLIDAEALLQYSLRAQPDLRRALRDGFWEHVRTLFPTPDSAPEAGPRG
ncbi:NYN domain-containing protein [Streptomyces sp. NPDC001054]